MDCVCLCLHVRACATLPSNSNFTSFAIRFWSSRSCFSISLLFFASGSSLFPFPKHMILGIAIHRPYYAESIESLRFQFRTSKESAQCWSCDGRGRSFGDGTCRNKPYVVSEANRSRSRELMEGRSCCAMSRSDTVIPMSCALETHVGRACFRWLRRITTAASSYVFSSCNCVDRRNRNVGDRVLWCPLEVWLGGFVVQ
jgi:hypothetical protein